MAEINNGERTKTFRIGRKVDSQIEAAKKYYSIIAAVYDIPLTKMEIGILAYSTIYGTISTPPAREAFIKAYKSSKASMNNLISKLQKRSLLMKDSNLKIRVVPAIALQFDGNKYIFNVNISIP